ncbi:MAG: hypothetical protein ACK4FS_05425 [Flavobacterium sp.]
MEKLRLISIYFFLFLNFATYTQSNELKEKDFDIESLILNSTSLSQIMVNINFSFEQHGEKRKSENGTLITVRYENNSLITPLVTYTLQGEVSQIIFLMPRNNVDLIGKELIKKYGTKVINSNEIIQRGSLTYDIRYDEDGEIGILIIK